jgi:hypothetical protein
MGGITNYEWRITRVIIILMCQFEQCWEKSPKIDDAETGFPSKKRACPESREARGVSIG